MIRALSPLPGSLIDTRLLNAELQILVMLELEAQVEMKPLKFQDCLSNILELDQVSALYEIHKTFFKVVQKMSKAVGEWKWQRDHHCNSIVLNVNFLLYLLGGYQWKNCGAISLVSQYGYSYNLNSLFFSPIVN